MRPAEPISSAPTITGPAPSTHRPAHSLVTSCSSNQYIQHHLSFCRTAISRVSRQPFSRPLEPHAWHPAELAMMLRGTGFADLLIPFCVRCRVTYSHLSVRVLDPAIALRYRVLRRRRLVRACPSHAIASQTLAERGRGNRRQAAFPALLDHVRAASASPKRGQARLRLRCACGGGAWPRGRAGELPVAHGPLPAPAMRGCVKASAHRGYDPSYRGPGDSARRRGQIHGRGLDPARAAERPSASRRARRRHPPRRWRGQGRGAPDGHRDGGHFGCSAAGGWAPVGRQ